MGLKWLWDMTIDRKWTKWSKPFEVSNGCYKQIRFSILEREMDVRTVYVHVHGGVSGAMDRAVEEIFEDDEQDLDIPGYRNRPLESDRLEVVKDWVKKLPAMYSEDLLPFKSREEIIAILSNAQERLKGSSK